MHRRPVWNREHRWGWSGAVQQRQRAVSLGECIPSGCAMAKWTNAPALRRVRLWYCGQRVLLLVPVTRHGYLGIPGHRWAHSLPASRLRGWGNLHRVAQHFEQFAMVVDPGAPRASAVRLGVFPLLPAPDHRCAWPTHRQQVHGHPRPAVHSSLGSRPAFGHRDDAVQSQHCGAGALYHASVLRADSAVHCQHCGCLRARDGPSHHPRIGAAAQHAAQRSCGAEVNSGWCGHICPSHLHAVQPSPGRRRDRGGVPDGSEPGLSAGDGDQCRRRSAADGRHRFCRHQRKHVGACGGPVSVPDPRRYWRRGGCWQHCDDGVLWSEEPAGLWSRWCVRHPNQAAHRSSNRR
mmetsp:Transcript_8881/g.20992  ORF Transcript_8881/g.20992 Transcript_8881/m.20992 type:complete len:348 (-) Transcript_8881:2180-3223(-)